MKTITKWIDQALTHHDEEAFLLQLKNQVKALCAQFPVPQQVS
jgi:glycine/serine hydroxymethyltransferase